MTTNSDQAGSCHSLEDFDDLFVGDPVEIEKQLRHLLPEAMALEDRSVYLQILSQIALAQALQKQFAAAHATLDKAESELEPRYKLARARILLERGRVHWQSGDLEKARPLFHDSFALCTEIGADHHAINAAHLIAIIAKAPGESLHWNRHAIALAEKSEAEEGRKWLGSLYNNLGQAYIESGEYEEAFNALKRALAIRQKEPYACNIRVAKWGVARALRLLGRADEALDLLLALLDEYKILESQPDPELPETALHLSRGLVYEELAEVYAHKTKAFSAQALSDLSKDEWFVKLEPERLERLRKLQS